MALYFLKDNESDLLQMNFEQILNFVSETPKQILSGKGVTPNGEDQPAIIYKKIKLASQNMTHLSYTLEKLETEFK